MFNMSDRDKLIAKDTDQDTSVVKLKIKSTRFNMEVSVACAGNVKAVSLALAIS